MKKNNTLLAVILLIGVFIGLFFLYNSIRERSKPINQTTEPEVIIKEKPKEEPNEINMKITSSAFKNNEMISVKYTCDGEDINPPLMFEDVPGEAESLVLIVDDPDAPAKTWVHWVVYNIDPTVTEVKENSVPEGANLGINDFRRTGYGGPCPPSGTHRYFFKLYALDTRLEELSSGSKSEVEKVTEGHILDQAELIGLYSH